MMAPLFLVVRAAMAQASDLPVIMALAVLAPDYQVWSARVQAEARALGQPAALALAVVYNQTSSP